MVGFPNRIDKGVLHFPKTVSRWYFAPFFVYLATAGLAHQLLCRGKTAFLDIACVNQLVPASKALGIQRLGAVLQRTERMLVLADEHYWKRLWCVFEVAAFCRHANASRLVILPLHSSMKELLMALFVYIALSVAFFSALDNGQFLKGGHLDPTAVGGERYLYKILLGGALLSQPFIMLPIMGSHRSRSAMRALREFSVAEAQCYLEADRQRLLGVVDSAYGSLDQFNLAVRALFRHENAHRFEWSSKSSLRSLDQKAATNSTSLRA